MFIVWWDLGRLFKKSEATALYYILVEFPELKKQPRKKMFILITTRKYKLLFIFIQQKITATVLQ